MVLPQCIITPKDVLPNVNIPGVVVVWTYNDPNTSDMVSRITSISRGTMGRLSTRDGLNEGERVVLNRPVTLKDDTRAMEIREEDEKKQDEEAKAKTAAGSNKQATSVNQNGGT